jgi:hypothetical protein
MTLLASREEYRKQQRLTALAVSDLRRRKSRGLSAVVAGLAAYQVAGVEIALAAGEDALTEQGIDAPGVGVVESRSLVSGAAVVPLYEKAKSALAFDLLTSTMVANAFSTASTVDMLRRPKLTGYVRYLSPPSCSRCAVLAGRFYRYSQGFQRHPRCDCSMTPTTKEIGSSLLTDPMAAFKSGQISGLSKADSEAIQNGADIGLVVNVRRKAAGLTEGSSVIARAGRLTPSGIQQVASDRDDAIRLLTKFGYIR